jgi:hypothetical protein
MRPTSTFFQLEALISAAIVIESDCIEKRMLVSVGTSLFVVGVKNGQGIDAHLVTGRCCC